MGLRKDILFVSAVIVVFAAVSKIVMGLYTPMVTVESGSMTPPFRSVTLYLSRV